MNFFSPTEFVENYTEAGAKKAEMTVIKLFLLGILGGLFIGFGGVVTNTATHSLTNVSVIRMICGLLFPFGLVMVLMTGSELFTGNCLIIIPVMSKRTTFFKMLKNLVVVYIGNFIGAIMLAAACAHFGQLNYSSGALAVYTIKTAIAKCSLPFGNALVSGIFCNFLVCVAVMCSLCAKDVTGKILGTFIPICFFVICGFEHCIANMYYIGAGLFAQGIPNYADLAVKAGLDVSKLTWTNFFVANLLPVTLGNLAGGAVFAIIMWACHKKENK